MIGKLGYVEPFVRNNGSVLSFNGHQKFLVHPILAFVLDYNRNLNDIKDRTSMIKFKSIRLTHFEYDKICYTVCVRERKKCNTGNYCREFTGGLSMINEIYKTVTSLRR